ncbi:hypothetical protein CLOM_g630, partial [Closterium sp. NIES-68]
LRLPEYGHTEDSPLLWSVVIKWSFMTTRVTVAVGKACCRHGKFGVTRESSRVILSCGAIIEDLAARTHLGIYLDGRKDG